MQNTGLLKSGLKLYYHSDRYLRDVLKCVIVAEFMNVEIELYKENINDSTITSTF